MVKTTYPFLDCMFLASTRITTLPDTCNDFHLTFQALVQLAVSEIQDYIAHSEAHKTPQCAQQAELPFACMALLSKK